MAPQISPFVDPDWTKETQPTAIAPSAVMAAMPQDAGAPPTLTKLAMPSSPPVFAAAPAPEVTRTPTPIEEQIGQTQQRLKSDQYKDANPFGSVNNHPGVGGKILHALSVAGNIAGDIFAPSTMALIPGTQLNREVHEGGLTNRLQELEQSKADEEAREAQTSAMDANTAKTKLETQNLPQEEADKHRVSAATAGNLESEANLRNNPLPQFEVHDTANGPLFVNKQTGSAQHLSVDGLPVGPKLQTKTVQLEIGGKPHQVLVNDATGEPIKDLGESGEKPMQVNVGQERAAKNDVLKAYQPTLDAAQRMNIMTDNYEKAVRDHDQQAMLSLLANHIGMTLGAQKGARITKDILHEAQESRPWLQGIKAKFDSDGVLSGVTLTPSQMRQMVGLGQSMYQESYKKSHAAAQYLGSQDDGPERVPGAATIRYYVGLANGDQAKAKELAKADGWSVQ